MVPYTKELGEEMRHALRQVGKRYIFCMRDLSADDAGLYQLDVEDVTMFSTEFKGKFIFPLHQSQLLEDVFGTRSRHHIYFFN